MYKFETVYLYNLYKRGWTDKFETKDELVDYLALHYYSIFEGTDLNLTWNDMFSADDGNKYTRPYVFCHEDWTVVDVRIYRSEAWWKSMLGRKWRRDAYSGNEYGITLIKHGIPFRYRIDPVPFTGHSGSHGHYYRHPHTYRDIRVNSDPELAPYVRNARKHLPTSWDDIPRNHDRGWKSQKKRHQWE